MRGAKLIGISLFACAALLVTVAVGTASADYAFKTFANRYVDPYTKEATTQAGVHADVITEYTVNQTTMQNGQLVTDGQPKDIITELPAGFYGNPESIPFCTPAFLVANGGLCNPAAQVGILAVSLDSSLGFYLELPVYNMAATDDQTAVLAANVFGALVNIVLTVRTDGDYGLTADIHNINQGLPVYGQKLILWGVPADPVNDPLRLQGLFQGGLSAGIEPLPFLSLPARCGPVATHLRTDSWQNAGHFLFYEEPVTLTGCDSIDFEPSIKARPTTNAADSPTGLDVDITIPQSDDPEGLSVGHLRKATVNLPEGLTLNPSGANGLGACSPQQIGMTSAPGGGVGHFDKAPQRCPDSSRIGELEVDTPIFKDPLHGSVFVATPYDNPFNSLLAIYAVVEGRGIVAKIPGDIVLDPATGRMTATFDENPQLTFEHFKMSFFGGAVAPFQTPTSCGTFTATTVMTPWSAPESGPPATPSDRWAITHGPHDQRCVNSEAALPNEPSFEGGSAAPIAGAYRPFIVNLRREDGSQRFSTVTVTPPRGLIAKLAGSATCSDAALAAAAARPGTDEQAAPSCPASSQVGTAFAAAGAGPAPYNAPGKVYLAGPYKGAPLSLAVVTPALAGPFDLGTIVVRIAVRLDPATAQLTAITDPIPTMLKGIPLDVRSVSLRFDKPDFTLNPSSCDPLLVEGSLLSTTGAAAPLLSPFQLGECGQLKFKPKISLSLKGGTQRTKYPALTAVLKPGAGDANIDYVSLQLPDTELLAQEHIKTVCTRVQFAADQCPAGSVYGKVSVTTPLLDEPLTGNVILRSSSHNLPDLVLDLRGPASRPIKFEAAGKTDSVKGALRNTFEFVPDVPFTKLVVQLQGGSKSLLRNSRNICAETNKALVKFGAHDGDSLIAKPAVKASCGGKAKRKRGRR